MERGAIALNWDLGLPTNGLLEADLESCRRAGVSAECCIEMMQAVGMGGAAGLLGRITDLAEPCPEIGGGMTPASEPAVSTRQRQDES
jgi:hypothetical protein